MFEFIQRFFGKPTSSATAKERLRLVLLSDHLSLAPDVVEALKHDLLEVISRYVEVDPAHCDVTFEQREKQVAMLANIPILRMRSRPAPPPPAPPAEPLAASEATPPAEPQAAAEPQPGAEPADGARPNGRGKRRRRRQAPPRQTAPSPAAPGFSGI